MDERYSYIFTLNGELNYAVPSLLYNVLIDGLLMDLMDFKNELQSEGTSAKYWFQEQEIFPNNIVHNACH